MHVSGDMRKKEKVRNRARKKNKLSNECIEKNIEEVISVAQKEGVIVNVSLVFIWFYSTASFSHCQSVPVRRFMNVHTMDVARNSMPRASSIT